MTDRPSEEKKSVGSQTGSSERDNAWQLWRNMAAGGVVASERDKERMIERHKLVVNIIDINSQQLRCESAIAGLDIERACALREVATGSEHAADAAVTALDKRMAALSDESQRLAMQREFLNASLAEFDTAASCDDEKTIVGRA